MDQKALLGLLWAPFGRPLDALERSLVISNPFSLNFDSNLKQFGSMLARFGDDLWIDVGQFG